MKPKPINATHEVMACPACGLTITAQIEVDVDLGKPALVPGGRGVEISASPSLRRFSINHACPGPDEDDVAPEAVSA